MIITLIAAFLLTAGCLTGSTGLPGTSWTLIAYAGDDGEMVRADAYATLIFSGDGTVRGTAGCNSYSADYRVGRDQITISSPASTLMYCTDEGVMEQEARFLYLLSQVRSFEIDGDILTMYGSGGKELLVAGKLR
ncbi:META domain-containing protein [Methanocalculus sp. MSAO_Arc2]|uniref:META domain-containing protein n=1 Tax=Methanocalculus sp. MSAO_Arc2 TaxID=2293855 RepID=UPI0026B780E4